MKKKVIVIIIILICLLSLFFLVFNKSNKQNNSEKLRIISLAPNVTEIICALGAQDYLVGRTDYCNYPAQVESIQSIGDMYNLNFEQIISLNPDIVIASSIVNPETIQKLNDLNIKTYQFFHEYEGLEGNLKLITEIGQTVGKEKETDALIAELKNQMETVKSEVKKTHSCVLMITWGDWGDYAATGDTFIEDMLETAGGKNIAKDASYWAISKELLINEDPEYVFITDNSNYVTGDILEAFKNTAPYKDLSASKNNKVFVLENDPTTRQSVRSFEILKEIAEIMNNEE